MITSHHQNDNPLSTILGIQYPIIQAALGGGVSRSELAGAVSKAGGLGTLSLMPPKQLLYDLQKARVISGGAPIAVNLLMPYVRKAHIDVCLTMRPEVVSLFFGFDKTVVSQLKNAGIIVMHQVGNFKQAQRAIDDGADVLILQGTEAGGHIAGKLPLAQLVPLVRTHFPHFPLIAAGGIIDATSAKKAIDLGANGVSVGTRFLLTHESNAHQHYKTALLARHETITTNLFGFSWTALHRVVPNQATTRWLKKDNMAPWWLTIFNTLGVATRSLRTPAWLELALVRSQRWQRPFFTPAAMTRELINTPDKLVEATALYAGTGVTNINHLMTAAEVVANLATAFNHPKNLQE